MPLWIADDIPGAGLVTSDRFADGGKMVVEL